LSGPNETLSMNVLVVDDDPDVLRSIGQFLRARGHRVQTAPCGEEGLRLLADGGDIDIVITDLKMPDVDGFHVLAEVKRRSPRTDVIMVTGFGDVENAVRAMREGAFDFFAKPFKIEDLSAALQRTVRYQAMRRERDRFQERLERLDREGRARYGLGAFVGESFGIQEVRDLIAQVCRADATTVLVCGETGTGKELVARAIHYESGRSGGPFVPVDCSAIPESLVESEFYGHVKGAFTDARETRKGHFEVADGGTLFLDEVGDMDIGMQAKLLRTLEERRVRRVGGSGDTSVDVRVVSATNRELSQAISEGSFREDLYYRLNAFAIHIPPLRERRRDILPLASHFLSRYGAEMRKRLEGFTPEAAGLLDGHDYPGNVRELRNLVERAAILASGDRVTEADLRFDRRVPDPVTLGPTASMPDGRTEAWSLGRLLGGCPDSGLRLEEIERSVLDEALARAGGNQVRAAELLGISRDALRRRMKRYGLENPGARSQEPE
jgi:two-component system, NtrC family, response regulator AtoC